MLDSASRPTASLPELLAHRARHASDARLALDAIAGTLAALAASLLRPPGWVALLAAALCFATYGAWGILDRELVERTAIRPALSRVLRAGRASAAAVGALAALTLILAVVALALGTWIS